MCILGILQLMGLSSCAVMHMPNDVVSFPTSGGPALESLGTVESDIQTKAEK